MSLVQLRLGDRGKYEKSVEEEVVKSRTALECSRKVGTQSTTNMAYHGWHREEMLQAGQFMDEASTPQLQHIINDAASPYDPFE
jgi:hypothetical protein